MNKIFIIKTDWHSKVKMQFTTILQTDQVRVGEEHKARSAVDYLINGCLLYVRHVAQDGEDEDTSDEAGHGVDDARDDGVPGNI